MKVNLIVTAAGPNNGRAIPVTGAKFLIGRDPQCQLRPASQAISKVHCAILIHDGQVYVEDFGSTNGTLMNEVPVQGKQPLKDAARLKVGPLEFKVEITAEPTPTDGTPLPEALKKSGSAVAERLKSAVPNAPKLTPAATKPVPSAPAKEPLRSKPSPGPVRLPSAAATHEDADAAAAMLLSLDDDDSTGEASGVPEGSTIMEIPTIDAQGRPILPKKPEKVEVESSSAANDLLKRYFRRTS